MLQGWLVVVSAVLYIGFLFAVAWYGDRACRRRFGARPAADLRAVAGRLLHVLDVLRQRRPGRRDRLRFHPVYLGPILMFVFGMALSCCASCGWPRARTSPRSPTSSPPATARARPSRAIVTRHRGGPARCPTSPCSSRRSARSVETLLGPRRCSARTLLRPTSRFIIALSHGAFAVLFGTRHIDATEHQEGLMLAVAAESLVKLAAFLAVGMFVMFMACSAASAVFRRAPRIRRRAAGSFCRRLQRRHVADGDVPEPGVHRPAAAPVPRHGGREQLRERDLRRAPGCSRSTWC